TRARSESAASASATLLRRLAAEPYAAHRAEDVLADRGLSPADARALVQLLESEGRLTRLPGGIVVARAADEHAPAAVVRRCQANGTCTLAQLRDDLGTGRRVAQALLERMDSDGLTRRIGDERRLRRRSVPLAAHEPAERDQADQRDDDAQDQA